MANKQSNDGCLLELALFAGAGGGILGGHLLGWRTVCAVELEPYPASVLVARQNDGLLPAFPIWDDVCTFDGKPWRGIVDVVSGGFPCQDISAAGGGAGITGSRSGLWKEMARIIGEVRPRYAFVENSPMLASRGLGTVLGDLAAMGFDAEWCCLSAADCGAWHERNRIWILATNTKYIGARWREQQPEGEQEKINATDHKKTGYETCNFQAHKTDNRPLGIKSWGGFSGVDGIEKVVSRFCRMDDGMANRVHRISALGNGQVPIVAATAFKLLAGELNEIR